jgi:hypothetical protein
MPYTRPPNARDRHSPGTAVTDLIVAGSVTTAFSHPEEGCRLIESLR